MPNKFGDKARVQHILDAISEVEIYITNKNFIDFENESMLHNACILQLEVIGEACRHISETSKSLVPDIRWKELIGLRNIIAHEYFGIDLKII